MGTQAQSLGGDYASYDEKQQEFVTVKVGNQSFGISVMTVQDVLRKQHVEKVPLSPPMVAGLLNLRGRIVTVIDMHNRFMLPALSEEEKESAMQVVIEYAGEYYSLMVDSVGEVLRLPLDSFEKVPANLAEHWKGFSMGVFKLKGELLIILDVDKIVSG